MKALIAVLVTAFISLPTLAQEWVGGAEGGEDRGSVYLMRRETRKLASGNEMVFWGSASYLYYDLSESQETVRSPGVSAGAMYRWIFPNAQIGIGPGYDIRWTERRFGDGSTLDETEHGVVGMGEGAIRFSDRAFSSASVSYSAANEWLASRANLLYEIGRGLRIGPEIGRHGNDDLSVSEFGGIVEIAMDEQWLWLRAGQAREKERGGVEETRPYFSVGITHRF